MKVKEIYVEVRKSKNYQTYACGMTLTVEEGDNVELVTREAQATCRKRVYEQLKIDSPSLT